MAPGGDGAGGKRPTGSAADRPRPDRRAEALRANLKRRKAQTRARDEAPRGVLPPDTTLDAQPPGPFDRDG